MAEYLTFTGLVLKADPVGERDRRVTLLTRERGKIAAFARGARKQDSPLLGACQPFAFGQFQIFEGRNSYTITGAEIQNYFPEFRKDLTRSFYATYFCEVADYFTRENLPAVEMMKLLYVSLRALTRESLSPVLVRAVYELRMIALSGEGPQVFSCVSCGREGDLTLFSVKAGGLLCPDCKKLDPNGTVTLLPAVRYAMQYILTAPFERLYTFTLKEDALEQLSHLMEAYYRRYVDTSFLSLPFLDWKP